MSSPIIMIVIIMMCIICSMCSWNDFIQCEYSESSCRDDINCGSSAMGKRAGYFCDSWPFYSGGFAECCDENIKYYTCTHSVYSVLTNNVFCDFWYMTQETNRNELNLCDCKVNNGKYCISWICATISNYDFSDRNHTNSQFLSKLLLPNEIEIFGVHQCGYFMDHILNKQIKQYCYKYDDFKSCYCLPTDGDDDDDEYCKQWICHKYLNNAKNDLSLNEDYYNTQYHNYWNITQSIKDGINNNNINSSAIDMLKLSTKVSHEEYRCIDSYPNNDALIDKTECSQWRGNININNDRFSVLECGVEASNSDSSTFTQELCAQYDSLNQHCIHWKYNISNDDLIDTYSYKWQCHESGMNYRNNKQFTNFYLSTLIWSISIGFILLFIIFCYMRYKYITLSSFLCVQGWFFFIFGSIAAVHGGFTSFFIYFLLQFFILFYIALQKWKNRGKQPYGSIQQRYDFDPIEESVSIQPSQQNHNNHDDDDQL